MPIYTYICNRHGHKFEHYHATYATAVKSEGRMVCPKCGAKVKRTISENSKQIIN
jgi:putative FmdB family regulatory protein